MRFHVIQCAFGRFHGVIVLECAKLGEIKRPNSTLWMLFADVLTWLIQLGKCMGGAAYLYLLVTYPKIDSNYVC